LIKTKEWKHWLRTLGYPQMERAPRRNPTGLAAMHGSISSPRLGRVKVLSRNGLFLETPERWPIGETVSLTLQKEDTTAGNSELQIDLQARVASLDEDGIGLGFILPQELNAELWEHLIETADTPNESEEVRLTFRMVRTVLFICRLCPSGATEPISVVTEELDEVRAQNMQTIALAAESMLSTEPNAENMQADPRIIARILKDSSWEQDHLTQQLWAGLLASSCSLDGSDQATQEFVDLFVNLTPNQLHILVEACTRACDQLWRPDAKSTPVVISAEEMVRLSGISDLNRCATDVSNLHNYGLLERNREFSTFLPKTSFDITPTSLGLRLFNLCKRQTPAHVNVSSKCRTALS
jgi:hypothetical protein